MRVGPPGGTKMPKQQRKLLTATFLDRLSRLRSDSKILITVSRLGRVGEYAERIPLADPGMHSVYCGSNAYVGEIDRIDVRVIVYQVNTDLIVCYVDAEDLAHEWARKHRIELLPGGGVLRVIEMADDLGVVGESEERFIELGPEDRYPSLLAERVRRSIDNGGLGG